MSYNTSIKQKNSKTYLEISDEMINILNKSFENDKIQRRISIDNTGANLSIYKSDDSGKTWQKLVTITINDDIEPPPSGISFDSFMNSV